MSNITTVPADYCPKPWEKATPNYKRNLRSLWLTFGMSVAISIWYLAGSVEAICWSRNGTPTRSKQFIQANLLSGLLASMIAISLLYTTYPQPIEATLSIMLALSQASAVGWLDFPADADFGNVLSAKVPDLFAVGFTLWAVWDAKETFFETHDRNAEYPQFVLREPWTPFAVCAIANEIVMLAVYRVWLLERARRINDGAVPGFKVYIWIGCALFCASNIAGAVVAYRYFARSGCWPFTVALGASPIPLLCGTIYACCQTYRRLKEL